MEWINQPDDIKDYYGFVYIIRNKKNGKYYIGKKFFWSKRTLPPLKGKTRKRHKLIESDWKNYWGSSNKLKEDIKKYGKKNFEREILYLCENKFHCAYMELLEQINRNVLYDKKSYNEIINVRLRARK